MEDVEEKISFTFQNNLNFYFFFTIKKKNEKWNDDVSLVIIH